MDAELERQVWQAVFDKECMVRWYWYCRLYLYSTHIEGRSAITSCYCFRSHRAHSALALLNPEPSWGSTFFFYISSERLSRVCSGKKKDRILEHALRIYPPYSTVVYSAHLADLQRLYVGTYTDVPRESTLQTQPWWLLSQFSTL